MILIWKWESVGGGGANNWNRRSPLHRWTRHLIKKEWWAIKCCCNIRHFPYRKVMLVSSLIGRNFNAWLWLSRQDVKRSCMALSLSQHFFSHFPSHSLTYRLFFPGQKAVGAGWQLGVSPIFSKEENSCRRWRYKICWNVYLWICQSQCLHHQTSILASFSPLFWPFSLHLWHTLLGHPHDLFCSSS